MTFELRRGAAVLDRVHSYFGFRTVTAEHGRVADSTAAPSILKMVLDQGYWPREHSDAALRRGHPIRHPHDQGDGLQRRAQAPEAGRSALSLLGRPHGLPGFERDGQRLAVRRRLRRAASPASGWRRWSATTTIRPSSSGCRSTRAGACPNLREPRQQYHLQSLYTLTHSLDATRLVIDNEGWEHTDMTDLFAIHDYARTGELLLREVQGPGQARRAACRTMRARRSLPGYSYNGSPFYLSEFGGIAFIPPGTNVPEESWGYSGVEKTADARAGAPARPVRRPSPSCRLRRHLLHAAHRRGAGDQRADDVRPQAEV